MKYVSGPGGKWVEANDRRARERVSPMVWDDLKDYRPIAGPEAEKFIRKSKEAREISGRKQHREYLKRNGLQEVGNELKHCMGKTPDNPTKDWLQHGAGGQWARPNLERLMRGKRR